MVRKKMCVLLNHYKKCRLDRFLEYRGHAKFRTRDLLSISQVLYWKRPFSENYLVCTVFCFLSLSKGFVFSPAFVSTYLLNKRTEVLDCFIEIEKYTVNMLSIASVFQANELIKGVKLIT